jgi:tetratricopeptide (TPR) repeat protein
MMHFAAGTVFAEPTVDEVKAKEAERAGKLTEALGYYVSALQALSEDSKAEQRVRKEIIALVNKMDPKPAIPDEAKRYFLRGEAAVEMAKDNAGYQKAADEFKQALKIAPWYPSGYYNLGMVQDKTGDYSAAIRNLDYYLLLSPNTQDAEAVRSQIVKLQYKLEQHSATPPAEIPQVAVALAVPQETQAAAPNVGGIWKRYNMTSGGNPATWEFRVNNGSVETRVLDAGFGETYVTNSWTLLTYDPNAQTLTDPYDPADPNKFLQIISPGKMRERVIWEGRYLEFEWRRED